MPSQKRLRNFIRRTPLNYRFWRERIRTTYEKTLDNPPVITDVLSEFPEAAELRKGFKSFRKEALGIANNAILPANHQIMREQTTFYEFDRIPWQMITLRAYTLDYPENMALMPRMRAFLQNNPHISSAAVSVFPPGKHLRPHKGPFKGVWRYHLAYFVQDLGKGRTNAELTIDGQRYYLREGEDLLWDDTFLHEARNRGDQPRVVLLLDVIRRGMPWHLHFITRRVMRYSRLGQRLRRMRQRAKVIRQS